MKQAVIDLGFGDSGKGITTSFLSQGKRPEETLVIRANGGPQAGHTVHHNNIIHVFSQFGSGTLQGMPTYFSDKCAIYPPSLMREFYILNEHCKPKLFIDPLTMVTTPWDIDANRGDSKNTKHGSVGMGFGKTIQRHQDYYKLFYQDLFVESILRAKLYNIVYHYYGLSVGSAAVEIEKFIEDCKTLTDSSFSKMRKLKHLQYPNLIFESAQGILLDQDFGFFPNVTRSNTTSKNIIELAPDLDEVYYVTRTYQTRHGNGFMTNEDKPAPVLGGVVLETNKSHPFQGEFRIAELDIQLLQYSLYCDSHFMPDNVKKNLVVTCYDQHKIDLRNLIDSLDVDFNKLFVSHSPDAKDFQEIKI